MNALCSLAGFLLPLAQEDGDRPGLIQMLFPLILIFFVFYVFLIRPQNKRRRQRMEMLSALRKGDKVITTGGIHGIITHVRDQEVVVKVGDDVRLTLQKSGIAHVKSPAEDAAEEDAEQS
ncbi:MAG: preprotein translocase subunit YajC [Candidatus Brocadiia bacterium]